MAHILGYETVRWVEGMYERPKGEWGYVFVHREVASMTLGRKLTSIETVHHGDENRSNNDPANLFVFRTLGDHTRYHQTGVMIDMGDGTWTTPELPPVLCATCAKAITPSAVRCDSCVKLTQRRAEWPSAEELRRLVWSMPTRDVAKRFGVSDVTVAKWCKKLEVDKPPRGYWQKQAALAGS